MRVVILGLSCVLLQGCSSVSSVDRGYMPNSQLPMPDAQISRDATGLAAAPMGGLEDGAVERLMNHRIVLPARIRVAVAKLSGADGDRNYSSEFNQLNDALQHSLIATLRASDRLYDASFLPSIMLPKPRSINVLRESAARFQADMLLAYSSNCETFARYRFLVASETKSVCEVEAVLLDTRSGVIAKTVVASQEFTLTQQGDHASLYETRRKAELDATSKALGEVATATVAYLKSVPVSAR